MTLIKNCGLKTASDMDMAAFSGASFIGFVHYAPSPRHLDLPEMAALQLRKPEGVKSVAVLVHPSEYLAADVATIVKPDYLQLHATDAAHAAAISERTRLPLILAIGIRSPEDLMLATALEPLAEHLLLDAPESGSGQPFDWSILRGVSFKKPWFLAGGLTAQNVRQAIEATGAPMVDVSSGIEDAPGHKSPEMIAAFNRAVLHPLHG